MRSVGSYEKKGMKTMFGKRYPNCVKKKLKGKSIQIGEMRLIFTKNIVL